MTDKSISKARRPGLLRRMLRIALVLILLLIAIPLVMVPLYSFGEPVSVPMLERQVTGRPMTRIWRPIDQISDRLKAAVMMSEDGQFCRHWGIDLAALRAEIGDLFAGRPTRGASTITMQVARNLFLWNDRSYVRKVLEIPLSLYIDLVLSKRRIMEIYLNIAEWGPEGQFGAEAGAQAAFGTGAQALTWERAALLAVMLPNPHERFAGRPSRHLGRVADIVEGRARAIGSRIACLYAGTQPLL